MVDLWERSGTFTSSVTENIKKMYFPLLETVGGAAVDSEEGKLRVPPSFMHASRMVLKR